MHLRRTLPALALLLFAAVAPGAGAPAKPSPAAHRAGTASDDAAARRALEAVVARYRTLASYRIEGQATSEVGGAQGLSQSATSMRFVVKRPFQFASEVRSADVTTRVVADGESLWTSVPQLQQYQVQSLAVLRAGADSAGLARLDPAADYARLLNGVSAVRALGRDTVRTARGAVACDRYALTIENPQAAAQGLQLKPRVLWVDPASRMVLLDSVRIEQNHPQLGPVHSVNVTRMVVAEADPALAANVFRFQPEAGFRRVRRFNQNSPEHAALEGQPAMDFTLDQLGDAKPIQLSGLKGKVVVLDFWATWCGPCRGWLPIVAKVRREYESKGLLVFAVNERETEQKVKDYLAKQSLDIPVLLDLSGNVGMSYHATSIPLTVVVGRDGRVVRVMLGLHEEDDLKDALKDAGID